MCSDGFRAKGCPEESVEAVHEGPESKRTRVSEKN